MDLKGKSLIFDSDKALFLRLKKYQDRQAFLTAYDLYVDDIFRFVYFKIGNKEDAEDLTSAAFLKCWSCVQEGRLDDSNEYRTLKSFLYKIARNLTIDYYRQAKPQASLEEIEETELATDSDQTADRVAQVIDRELLIELMAGLKTEYRSILVLKYLNDLSIAEIADILGKNKGNVRVTLFRALNALKELTNDHD